MRRKLCHVTLTGSDVMTPGGALSRDVAQQRALPGGYDVTGLTPHDVTMVE